MHLVDPIRAALHRRATLPETPEAQHMDETFAQKAAAWAEGGVVGEELPARSLKASRGARRLKGSTGGSIWGSGSTSVLVARRRTPARPAAALARRTSQPHLYQRFNGRTPSHGVGFRRRRTAPPSWCIAPPGAATDMMECSDAVPGSAPAGPRPTAARPAAAAAAWRRGGTPARTT